jgi:hypothetical protein
MFKDKPLGEIRTKAKQLFKGDYVGADHYNRLPDHLQPAEVAHAWGLDFLLWNTIKYLSRAGHKATTTMSANEKEIDDLSKAIDYINMRINVLEGRTPLSFNGDKQDILDVAVDKAFDNASVVGMNDVADDERTNKRVPSEEEVKTYYRNLASKEADDKPNWLDEPIESFAERWNVDTVTNAAKIKEKHDWVKANPNKSDMRECWGDAGE